MKELQKVISQNQLRSREKELEERVKQLEIENASLKASRKRLERENWGYRIDPRTGLERERSYYPEVNNRIMSLIEDSRVGLLLQKDALSEADIKALDAVPLSVTHADLGYLSKYNEDPLITEHYGEHAGGDTILEMTGALIQTVDKQTYRIFPKLGKHTRGYRIGGDEFALLQNLTKEDAKHGAVILIHKQSHIEIKGSDLKPTLNAGTASFREAVEAFYNLYSSSARTSLSSAEKAVVIQRLLTEIAERRAKLSKLIDRLTEMSQLLQQNPDVFDRNFRWLQKGALGLDRSQFERLADLMKRPVDFMKNIKKIAERQLTDGIRVNEDREHSERSVVVEIADRDF